MYTDSDNDFWKQSALLLGAEFKPREYWHSPKITRLYKGVNIVFDSYCHTGNSGGYSFESYSIRICVTFDSQSDFKFKMSKKGLISSFLNIFSPNSYKLNDNQLDKQLDVKTNDRQLTDKLLGDNEIQILLKSLEVINLEIGNSDGIWGDTLPDGKLVLSYFRQGRTIDEDQILLLNELFEKLIDKMYKWKIIK